MQNSIFKRSLLATLLISGSIAFSQTTFNYTGASQSYTVPAGVTEITIECWGAQGGGDSTMSAPGGLGGYVIGELMVTPGQMLEINVGGQGSKAVVAGGFNGGGAGTGDTGGSFGGSGGGASDVRMGGSTLADRIMVAGGGGGGAFNAQPGVGGDGGGLTGADGVTAYNGWGCMNFVPPTGGSQIAGGINGSSSNCGWDGSPGSLGIGGDAHPTFSCGGGGAGYYGGGGAANGQSGAGGSSYADVAFTGVAHTQGSKYGDGMVVITPVCNPTTSSITEMSCINYMAPSGAVFSTTGIYTDTIANVAGCDSIITIDLTINTVDITVSQNNNELTSNAVGAAYQWLDCNNSYAALPGETTATYTASSTGSFAVEVTENGCTDTSACFVPSFVSLSKNELSSFNVYPNPSNGTVFIEVTGAEIYSVKVLDISGKMIFTKVNISADLMSFDLNEPSGIYFVEINTEDRSATRKLIIR